ncbi:hypothetical protein SVAN01_10006 [Stagonosporopsis vannaccii]|nr:hypothetical protein SVAN01_10006 [Stagonosporopsis vannaccii]
MSSKATSPKLTARRGSPRLKAKKAAAALATLEAKPAKVAHEKKISEKKATTKAVAGPKTAGTKRKSPSPSPELDDLESETEIGLEESPAKKSKPSSKSQKSKAKKADTEKDISPLAETVTVDSTVLVEHITQAIQAAIQAPMPITAHVTKGIRNALNPYLDVLDPFMHFQMLCTNRTADTALGQEIEEMRVTVLDKVRELQTSEDFEEKEEC